MRPALPWVHEELSADAAVSDGELEDSWMPVCRTLYEVARRLAGWLAGWLVGRSFLPKPFAGH